MPAATADTLSLPRIVEPAGQGTQWRRIHKVVTAHRQMEGAGFVVRRPFPGMDLSLADPFLLLDHLGEVEYAPGEAKGAPWHPHRGFETVTYIIDGAIEHHDSTGGGGLISDGGTQWMTAGAGILHDEVPPESLVRQGGLFHGVQLWVNLPAAEKFAPPRYQDIEPGAVRLLTSADGGALVRLIAGSLGGFEGPGVTHTPITYLHATIAPGARLALPWPAEYNALVYVLSGRGVVDGRTLEEGQLAVLGHGEALAMQADPSQPTAAAKGWDVLVLGGLPIRESVARYGPFVMNTKAEIIEAIEDYQAGRMGVIPAIHLPHTTSSDGPAPTR